MKIRDADRRMVSSKAARIALGVTRDGEREVLGLWSADSEGAKLWLSVMNELRNRGLQDILIAVVDGLKPPTACAAPLMAWMAPASDSAWRKSWCQRKARREGL